MAELHAQVGRLADAAIKLLHEAKRLRQDVVRLHGRIEPYEDEKRFSDIPQPKSRIRSIKDAIDILDEARAEIRQSEYELTAIRGVVEGIGSDAISRAEMKPWLQKRRADVPDSRK